MGDGSQSEDVEDIFLAELVAAIGEGLVQDGKRVAHTSIGEFDDHLQRPFFVRHAFAVKDPDELFADIVVTDFAKVIALATGDDGGQDFEGFCRRQDEDDMLRGFFEGLKQRVERTGGHHMNFVDDVDLIFAADRRITHFVDKVTDLFHTVITRGVDFHDVGVRGGIHRLAVGAMVALMAKAFFAVERLCE